MASLNDGLEQAKGAMSGLIEPALIFASTGSKAAATWGGLKAVLLTKVLGPVSLLSGALLGVVGITKQIVAQTNLMANGMQKLRQLETLKTQFAPLVGGAKSAENRLKELYTFAAKTPFQLSEIAEASKTLEILTRGALSTGENLRMLGDVAAQTGQSMQTISFWTGRLYSALKGGQPIGEATARLLEMGVISGEVRTRLQDSAAAGDSFIKTFDILTKEMERAKGGMEDLSKTLEGLESTLVDVKGQFAAGFAMNFKEGETAALKTQISLFESMAEPVQRIGFWLSRTSVAFSKLVGRMAPAGEGTRQLGKNLSLLVDAFVAVGTAIAGVQIATLISGMMGLSKATGVATLATAKSKFESIKAALARKTEYGAVRLNTIAYSRLSLAHKKALISGGVLAGGTKVLTLVFTSLTNAVKASFAAMVANPLTAIITAALTLGTAIYSTFNRMKQLEEEVNSIRQSTKEMSAEFLKAAAAVKTLDDKLQLIGDVDAKIAATTSEIKKLADESKKGFFGGIASGIGNAFKEVITLGKFDGKSEETAKQEALLAKLKEQQELRRQALNLDRSSLQLVQQRIDHINRELEVQRAMKDLARERALQDATAAERIFILSKQIAEVQKKGSEGRAISEQKAILAEESRERQIRQSEQQVSGRGDFRGDEQLEQMKAQLQMLKALENQTKGITDAKKAAAAVTAFTPPTQAIVAFNKIKKTLTGSADPIAYLSKEIEKITRFVDQQDKARKSLVATQKEEARTASGAAAITKDALASIVAAQGDLDKIDFVDESKLGTGGLLGALNELLSSGESTTGKLNQAERKAIQATIESLNQKATAYQEQLKLVEKLKIEVESLARKEKMRVGKELSDQTLRADKMAANDMKGGRIIADLEAQIRHQGRLIALTAAHGDKAKSLADLKKEARQVSEEILNIENKAAKGGSGGTGDGLTDKEARRMLTLDQQAVELKKAIKKAEQDVTLERQKQVDVMKKLLQQLNKVVEENKRLMRNLREDLENELRDIAIDVNIRQNNLDKAADLIKKDQETEDRQADRNLREKLQSEGKLNAGQIDERVRLQQEKRQAQRQEGRDKTVFAVERDLAKARLEMQANLGDGKARRELDTMQNFDLFKENLAKNLRLGMEKGEAKRLATDTVNAKLMREVNLKQPVADSFRAVGLGGTAVSTDPLKQLAQKQADLLKKIAENTAPLANNKVKKVDIDKVNEFLNNLPVN